MKVFWQLDAKDKKQLIRFEDDLHLDPASFLDGELQHNCALSTFTKWRHQPCSFA